VASNERDPDDEDPAHRMTMNLLALVVSLLILGAGFWLTWHLAEAKLAQDCIAAGFRNCSPKQNLTP
jgi:hypothetical protein